MPTNNTNTVLEKVTDAQQYIAPSIAFSILVGYSFSEIFGELPEIVLLAIVSLAYWIFNVGMIIVKQKFFK